jgi:DNA-binding MarR family transcriptional regulator
MAGIYDSSNFDPRASIGGMVGRTRTAFLSAMDEVLGPFDLTTPQYVAIILVASGAAVRAADICKMLAHDPGAMTRLIDHLEQRNFVRRVSDPDDRRALKLELTAQGQALYPHLIAAAVKVNNRLLQGFSKGEVRQMESFFKRMLANAEDTAEVKS